MMALKEKTLGSKVESKAWRAAERRPHLEYKRMKWLERYVEGGMRDLMYRVWRDLAVRRSFWAMHVFKR